MSLYLQSSNFNSWASSSATEKAKCFLSLNGYAVDAAPVFEGPSFTLLCDFAVAVSGDVCLTWPCTLLWRPFSYASANSTS